MSAGVLPGYLLEADLGSGSMGTVHLARRTDWAGRLVAVKRVPSAGAHLTAVLRHEAEVLAALDHPHIVRILDLVPDGDGVAIAMQYAAGGSLPDLLARRGRLSPGEVVAVAAPVADALASAHRRGVLHCDVKPANILFTSDGEPLLSDFGLARRMAPPGGPVGAEPLVGTAEYLDPAVVAGAPADQRSDVYGLGAVCYELLTGRAPYSALAPDAVIDAALAGPPSGLAAAVGDGVPLALVHAVERAMARRRADRFADAAAFAAALRAATPATPVAIGAAVPPVPPWAQAPSIAAAVPPGPPSAQAPSIAAAVPPGPPWAQAPSIAAAVPPGPPWAQAPSIAASLSAGPPSAQAPSIAAAVPPGPPWAQAPSIAASLSAGPEQPAAAPGAAVAPGPGARRRPTRAPGSTVPPGPEQPAAAPGSTVPPGPEQPAAAPGSTVPPGPAPSRRPTRAPGSTGAAGPAVPRRPTRTFGPRPPAPTPTPPRPERAPRGRRLLAIGAGLAVVAGLAVAASLPGPEGARVASRPQAAVAVAPAPSCPTVAGPLRADVDGDGCPSTVSWEDNVAEVEGRRYELGLPGDALLMGDWDCDGSATPALYRPATGEVFLFARWADPGPAVSATDGGRVAALDIPAVQRTAAGCDHVTVKQGPTRSA